MVSKNKLSHSKDTHNSKQRIRKSAVAGYFYPEHPTVLADMIEQLLSYAQSINQKNNLPQQPLRALVVPHAGYRYSGQVAAVAYALLLNHLYEFDRVLLLGPSHRMHFVGLAASGMTAWQTPLGKSALDLTALSYFTVNDQAHEKEHCLEVQVPFLQYLSQITKKDILLIPLLAGNLHPYDTAQFLLSVLKKPSFEKTLLLITSDLSHYLPYHQAMAVDQQTIRFLLTQDIERMAMQGDACGLMPLLVLMHFAKEAGWHPFLLDLRNSGDTAGDPSAVVGYASVAYF
ncbi:MAG: AmmeMemoRadiSam system protein B [Candidatus Woesearchaeota archaeon]